jgi:AcrR family transcriptional regulator
MLDVSHLPALDQDAAGSRAYREFRRLEPGQDAAPQTPAAAFRLARRRFLAQERLDMRALADELGVSRQTLYRWTGPREELLSDILFALSDASFQQAIDATAGLAGAERLLAVFRHHVTAIVTSRPLQAFVRRETHTALRILTARDGSVNARTITRLAELYRAEQREGHFTPRADIDTLAFAVVCLTESFIYNDARGAVEPEVERAAGVVALLLGAG